MMFVPLAKNSCYQEDFGNKQELG